jgi:hypothetical protein
MRSRRFHYALALALPTLLGLTIAAATGCKKPKEEAPPKSKPTATVTAAPAPAAPEWITHPPSGTKFHAPPGWKQLKDEDTMVFVSPDNKAVLAFESYPAGTDPGATIMIVARKLKLDDLDWKGGTKEGKFGKDAIPGRFAEGTCSFKGEQSSYSYATLNPGGPKQILIIYAVQKSASDARKQEAIDTIKSLQRT